MIPLATHPTIRTTDPEAWFDNLVRRNPGIRPLSSEVRARPPRFCVNHVDLAGVSLAAGRCSPYAVELPAGAPVRIHLPMEGTIHLGTPGGDRAAGAADVAVVMPRQSCAARFPDGIASLVVTAGTGEVEALLPALECDAPLAALQDAATRGGVPLPARIGLLREVRHVCRMLDEESAVLTSLPTFREGLRNLILARIADMLAAQKRQETRGGHPDQPALRRCLAYLEDMAGGDVSLFAMARSAGISIRTAQALFRRHLDMTPTAYLRRLRLDRARRMLEHPAAETTVTMVAHAAGFTHLSDFAAVYQARYGEPPSATLRGARRR